MDEHEDFDGATSSTANGLMQLSSIIAGMVREGALDTRFGAKLLKRLEKEAKRVIERGPVALEANEQDALFDALGELDVTVRESGAALLVQANARLRDTESAPAKRRKSKKDEEA